MEAVKHYFPWRQNICFTRHYYAVLIRGQGSLMECSVVKGSYHGFDFDHESPLVRRVLEHRCEIIQKILVAVQGQGNPQDFRASSEQLQMLTEKEMERIEEI